MGHGGVKARAALNALMLSVVLGVLPAAKVLAEGTLCAEVRLEIKQEATLEREAFDAALEVTNQYPAYGLTNFRVNIIVKNPQGANADNLFFVKISSKEAISAVDGTGTIQPASTATVHWLIIPSTGAGGANPLGITYSIRADISYDLNGVHQSISTFDDNIVVKPQPALKLEYVLPFEVFADEALTEGVIEPVEPFPLGVRITNVGYGPAKNFQINSGQPKIIESKQGLDIDFKLLGTYIGDKKIPDTLLIPFGDISAGAVTQSAWIMATSLSGRFTKFDATFSHSAELGGQLTSLIKDVTTYTLVKDMRVDLPGRDSQFDFLVNTTTPRGEIEALLNSGGEVVPNIILESDQAQPINVVHLPSALTGTLSGANTSVTLKLTEAAGANLWVFASAPAPQDGKAVLVSAVRQDGKAIDPKNIWISKHFNKSDTQVTYRFNIIDYNPPSEAAYTLTFSRESLDAAPGAISDLSAHTAAAGGQTSLNWSATGEDASTGTIIGGRYLIQAATSPTSEFRPTLAQVNITTNTAPGVAQSYLLGSLAGNASYYVKLWLQDTGGNISADSNLAEAFVLPNPPNNLVVSALSSVTAAVGWNGGNNNLPIEYGVWADTDAVLPAVSTAPFKDSFDRAFVFTGLTPNTTYSFYGLAKNPESGITSEQAYLGEALTLAAEPGQIQSSQLFTSSFTVAWDGGINSGLTKYFVQVSTVSNWSVVVAESGWVNQPSYAFGGLASDTTYYLRAKARNVAGVETAYTDIGILRTAAVDTLAPVTAISFAGPYFSSATVYVSSFTEITLAASDDSVVAGDKRGAVAAVHYAVDSDTFSVYAGTFSIVGGGEHMVRFFSADTSGNTEEVKTSSITVDDAAPMAQVKIAGVVFSSASISYVPAASTVTLTAADGASGVKELYYEVNGSTYAVATDSKTLELGEGSYALGYSAADKIGNASELKVSSVVVDNTAPHTEFSIEGSSRVIDGVLYALGGSSLTLSASDALAGVKEIVYSLDGSTYTAAQPLVLPITAGEHVLAYYSVDNVGNAELERSVTYFMDAEAPVATAAVAGLAGANGWYVWPVSLTLDSTDTMSGVEGITYALDRVLSETERVLLSSGAYTGRLDVGAEGVYSYAYSAADRAGNITPETTGYFKIDLSTPVIVALSTPAANASTWNNSAVTTVFSGTDSVSGIAFCTPATLVELEGSSQTINGYCTDFAGLTSTASVTVNIDTTAPVVSYARVPAAGTDGWNNSDVAVNFTCADALSGVAACPAGIILSSEGVDLSTAAAASDFAGNYKETNVAGIKIDRTAPVSTSSVSGINNNGYYGASVAVTIASTDTLSGVTSTYYSLDGGEFAEYQAPVQVSADGRHTVRYYAKDKAGNEEAQQAIELNIDIAAPVISYTATPQPNSNSWNNSVVEVVFTGTDTLSGIASCTSTVTVSVEGGSQTVVGSCTDLAGNIAYSTAIVSVDLSTPGISAAGTPAPNVYGWNKASVSVVFTGTDSVSGLASCTPAAQIEIEGSSQPVDGYCTDYAGLVSTITYLVSIDTSSPSLAYSLVPEANAAGWNNSDVAANFTCADALSGVASCPAGITLSSEGVDLSTAAAAYDFAGNRKDVAVTGVKIDKTAPVSTAAFAGVYRDGHYISSATVTIEASDALSGVAEREYSLDDGTFTVYTSTFAIETNGAHTLVFRSKDMAGNQENDRTTVVNVAPADALPPVTSLAFAGAAFGVNPVYVSTNTSLLLTSTDDVSTAGDGLGSVAAVYYAVNADTFTLYAGGFTVAAGTNTLKYYGVDAAGNVETVRISSISADSGKPTTSMYLNGVLISSAPWVYVKGGAVLTLGPVDNLNYGVASGVAITTYTLSKFISSPGWVMVSSGAYTGPLAMQDDGQYEVNYQSVDNTGNVEAPKLRAWYVDATMPEAAALINGATVANGAGVTIPSTQTVTLSAIDPIYNSVASGVSGISYTLDTAFSTAAATAYAQAFVLSTGTHVLYYSALDIAGNQADVKIASITVIVVQVDTAAPLSRSYADGVLLAGGTGYLRAGTVLTLVADDAVVNGYASGVAFTTYTITQFVSPGWVIVDSGTYTGPIVLQHEGYYTLYYQSRDNAGNLEDFKNRVCYVDGTAPLTSASVSGVSLADGATVYMSTSAAVVLIATDSMSGAASTYYTLDAEFSTMTATVYAAPFMLAAGTHTLRYMSVDKAGNSEAVKSLLATVDSLAPLTKFYVNGVVVSSTNWQGYMQPGSSITLVATDALENGSASGIANTFYEINELVNSAWVTTSGTYSGPLVFNNEGSYRIYYWSVDNAGNLEGRKTRTRYVDGIAPVTTIAAAGAFIAVNTTGYINASDAVSIISTDTVSNGIAAGVTSTYYLIDAAPADISGPCPVSSGTCAGSIYAAPLTLESGNHVLYYASLDRAGNQEAFKMVYLNVSSGAAAGIASYVRNIGSYGSGAGQFDGPSGVTVSPGNAEIYVADSRNHRVQKFSSYGKFLLKFGSAGSGQGQFGDSIIAVGPGADSMSNNNQIYVADPGNYRIQRFGHYGDFIGAFGSHGGGSGQFESLAGIALAQPGSEVYAVDSVLNKVSVFLMTTGALRREFGSAGSGPGQFNGPRGVAMRNGMVYVADTGNKRVQKFTSAGGFLTQWASDFITPYGIWVDASDRVLVSDVGSNKVEMFDSNGLLLGKFGASGSGTGQLTNPTGIGGDKTGSIYVADTGNNRVQQFKLTSLDVTPPADIAGLQVTNVSPFSVTVGFTAPGDGGPMVAAYDLRYSTFPLLTGENLQNALPAAFNPIPLPAGMYQQARVSGLLPGVTYYFSLRSQDSSGNVSNWSKWQAVTPASIPVGTLSMLSGGVTNSATGAAPLSLAYLSSPSALTIDKDGNLHTTHNTPQSLVGRIDTTAWAITRTAGLQSAGYDGDDGSALDARFAMPVGVVPDAYGNLIIADTGNNRIRKVAATTGMITTIAGTGVVGSEGDGGAAVNAALNKPMRPALDAFGNIYFADSLNNKIRRIDAVSGLITTMAGTGTAGFSGDDGPAVSASLNSPSGVRFGTDGGMYVSDTGNNRIRKIGANGIIVTIAGSGAAATSGDGGAAVLAGINGPVDVALDHVGNIYIAEQNGNKVRKVSVSGIITTAAGSGAYVPNNAAVGDVPAEQAAVSKPAGVAVDAARGILYIVDNFHIFGVGIEVSTVVDNTAPITKSYADGVILPQGTEGYLRAGTVLTLVADDAVVNGYASGVAFTTYTITQFVSPGWVIVDSGTYTGPIVLQHEGYYTLYYQSRDNAGNLEDFKNRVCYVDGTAPLTSASVSGVSLADGATVYMSTSAAVVLIATDSMSGAASTYYTLDAEFSTMTATVYAAPFMLAAGTHTLRYMSVDKAGNSEAVKSLLATVDSLAPLTKFYVNGVVVSSTNWQGYMQPGSSITLVATDALENGSASGIANTFYEINELVNSAWVTTSGTYSGPLVFNNEGSYRIYYWSVDNAGNLERHKPRERYVDGTAPLTSALVNGNALADGVTAYVTAADSVTLAAADPLSNNVASGVKNILYTIDVDFSTQTAATYSLPFRLEDGIHAVRYTAFDNAGNQAILKTVIINIGVPAALTADITPSSGPIGVPFYISGSGFGTYSAGTTVVLMGGAAAPLTLWSDTEINGTIPGTLAAGEQAVAVMRGTTTIAQAKPFTVTAPVIMSITPSSGAIGVPFTITGGNFGNYVANYTKVLIGGVTAPLTLWSDTKIQGTIPGGLAAGDCELVVQRELNGGLVSTTPSQFKVVAPTLLAIIPSSGSIGVSFTLTGSGFGNYVANYTRVLIGGATAPLTLWSDNIVQGTVPGSLVSGTYAVAVERELNGGLVRTSTVAFTLMSPSIASIAPSSGAIGVPFTINGASFGNYVANYTRVLIGGATAPLTLWSDTKIQGTIPGALTPGDYDLVVARELNGGIITTQPAAFKVVAPELALVAPSSGSIGIPFTITGSNFGNYVANYTKVLIGGAIAPLTLWTDTKIQGTIPGGLSAGDYELMVVRSLNYGEVRSSTNTFTVVLPVLNAVSPSTAAVIAPFTINGANFGNYVANYTKVLINGATTALTLWTDTQIKGKLPFLLNGTYPVQVQRNLNGGLAESGTAYITVAEPVISSMTPTSGAVGTVFNLYGANFGTYDASQTRVTIGGVACALSLWTDTNIRGTVPTAISYGTYTVVAMRGQALSNELEYTVPEALRVSMARPVTMLYEEFKLGEVYVYPNPAKGGKVPVFHVEVGQADSVKIRVFTVAGQAVHEVTLTGAPQAIGGKYAYEYAWEGHIASGVYYYTMEAEQAGKKLKAKGRFAVVR